jgi:epoxyqueuosine reductase
VAQYAFGEDYHFVLKWKLKELLKKARVEWGDFQGRAFVDSAPVHERAWARRAGLGWVGKNSLLLNKGMGSYFFLAELLVDLDLQPDRPNPVDHCGTCTRCIDACPTGAIIQPQVVDGSRCISYFTIELRGEIPEPYARQLGDWAFGCDVCQEVCPWNRHATPHSEPRLAPREGMMELSREDWLDLTEETFRAIFKETPLKRTGLDKIRRTITGGELRSQDWDRDSLRS